MSYDSYRADVDLPKPIMNRIAKPMSKSCNSYDVSMNMNINPWEARLTVPRDMNVSMETRDSPVFSDNGDFMSLPKIGDSKYDTETVDTQAARKRIVSSNSANEASFMKVAAFFQNGGKFSDQSGYVKCNNLCASFN